LNILIFDTQFKEYFMTTNSRSTIKKVFGSYVKSTVTLQAAVINHCS